MLVSSIGYFSKNNALTKSSGIKQNVNSQSSEGISSFNQENNNNNQSSISLNMLKEKVMNFISKFSAKNDKSKNGLSINA